MKKKIKKQNDFQIVKSGFKIDFQILKMPTHLQQCTIDIIRTKFDDLEFFEAYEFCLDAKFGAAVFLLKILISLEKGNRHLEKSQLQFLHDNKIHKLEEKFKIRTRTGKQCRER